MIDYKRINELVKNDVTEKCIMMSFQIDLNNIPPFIRSPFVEDWIWSENIKDLVNYIYEVLIPTYLINSIIAFEDSEGIEDREYNFIEAINLFRKNKKEKEILKGIDKISDMYSNYINRETSYLEFIKMVIKLEEVLPHVTIDFKVRCYANPYETRYSNMLKTDKFDYQNLSRNY